LTEVKECRDEKCITYFGVFSQPCMGLTDLEARHFLLKSFEDYGDALEYAESIGKRTAIHWTQYYEGS